MGREISSRKETVRISTFCVHYKQVCSILQEEFFRTSGEWNFLLIATVEEGITDLGTSVRRKEDERYLMEKRIQTKTGRHSRETDKR